MKKRKLTAFTKNFIFLFVASLYFSAQYIKITIEIPKEMHLGEAIIEVSKGKLGLGVSLEDNKVCGLITDGDIRRAMEKWQAEFFNKTVDDIMTHEPKTVLPTTKISEIQKIMHKYKIHTVLVIDQEKHLLGIVDHYSCMV